MTSKQRVAKFRKIQRELKNINDTSSSSDNISVERASTPRPDEITLQDTSRGTNVTQSNNDNFDKLSWFSELEASRINDFVYDSDSDYSILTDESEDEDQDIANDLVNWYNTFDVSQNSLSALLRILNRYHKDLPTSASTLLNKKSECVDLKKEVDTDENGEYVFFDTKQLIINEMVSVGSIESLSIDSKLYKNYLNEARRCNKILLSVKIGIDGVPLFKSSNKSLWPISILINEFQSNSRPIVIGAYYGASKPGCNEKYLGRMIRDFELLLKDGLVHENREYLIKIFSFIADAPARNLIKATKQFTGYNSCDYCRQPGSYNESCKKIIFPDLDFESRTDHDFRSSSEVGHQHSLTPLIQLPVDMIKDFPPDTMHSVYLGITKRLLKFYMRHIWRPSDRGRISQAIKDLSIHFPSEFRRRLRGINDIENWKAKQYRQFLLYLAPLVLKDFLPVSLYNHFTHFHFAIYALSLDGYRPYLDNARVSMIRFIKDIPEKLNISEMVYNTHLMSHLTDFADRFGPLDFWSAFPFESHFHHLKRKILSPSNISSQLERYAKRPFVFKRQRSLIVGHGKDRFVLLESGHILAVSRQFNQFPYHVSGFLLQYDHDVYTCPYPSSTFRIGFYRQTNKEFSGIASKKCVGLPYSPELYVIFPYVTNKSYIL